MSPEDLKLAQFGISLLGTIEQAIIEARHDLILRKEPGERALEALRDRIARKKKELEQVIAGG